MVRSAAIRLALYVSCASPVAATAAPIVIDGTYYHETGSAETVTATFTTPDGGVTTGSYYGFVEVTVSGTGMSDATAVNDAFYVLQNGQPTHDTNYYQLTFGTKPLVPLSPSQDAVNAIVYDLNGGKAVTPPYVPAYRASHTYDLVLDTDSLTGANLHFGVSDGQFSDNSGAYTIEVAQLVVPEPASWATFGAGLALLLGLGRARSPRVS